MGEQNNGFYSASPLQNDSNGPVMMTLLSHVCDTRELLSVILCEWQRGKKKQHGLCIIIINTGKSLFARVSWGGSRVHLFIL